MKFIKIAIPLLFIFIMSGCSRIQPVLDIQDAPVKYNLTQSEVKQAITTAAEGRKWIVTDVNNHEMKAELFIRHHYAVIKIPYNTKFYSLLYVDSKNLNHEAGKIHKNYNRWINILNGDIREELAKISAHK